MRPLFPARQARHAYQKTSGLSAQAVARKLGFSLGHLESLEAGRALWPEHQARKAARLYGVRDLNIFIRPATGERAQRAGAERGRRGRQQLPASRRPSTPDPAAGPVIARSNGR